MKRVLVIGQTPPPYHGQSMMIERLVKGKFQHLRIYHVRMAFSGSVESVGKFRLSKVLHLAKIVFHTIALRFRYGIDTLYYPPAGPKFVPVIRDVIILMCVRPFFKQCVFHFRAAGISEYLTNSPVWLQRLSRFAYRNPDVGIQLSALNPPDSQYFDAKKTLVIKNGLEDEGRPFVPIQRVVEKRVNVLFVGVLIPSKGVKILLEATKLLRKWHMNCKLQLMGGFVCDEFEQECIAFCQKEQLHDYVEFLGVKTGEAKWKNYKEADILCFPTYYEAESFGNVVLEAMMFELPVVGTRWRGVPDIVQDGKTGLLVPIQQEQALAEKLALLIENPDLRMRMGKEGRRVYEQEYRLESHLEAMEQVFVRLDD
ncbi:MAG: glycosyltransferase family 4 protein [Kiritimatiellia bacterium]|jgi:glycosyltransferase involved in cell wall biosynthesis|nr:glycosyltransferase family 4 protein [Kiritimatiellia bacterium]MDP6847852.1 glycosyltransferase family 4 protein [Kiritimatiellia bacterium]